MTNSAPKPPSAPGTDRPNTRRLGIYALFAVLLVILLAVVARSGGDNEETSYGTYVASLEEGLVTSVVRNNATGEITFQLDDEEQLTYVTNGPISNFENELELLGDNVEYTTSDEPGGGIVSLLSLALPLIFILALLWWMIRAFLNRNLGNT